MPPPLSGGGARPRIRPEGGGFSGVTQVTLLKITNKLKMLA